MAAAGDIRKAFLQIRIRECERDLPRFHLKKICQSQIETLRFTRALFGLALSSPFLLAGVLETHLDAWEQRKVAEPRRALYVDDLLTGGKDDAEAKNVGKRLLKFSGAPRLSSINGIRTQNNWKRRTTLQQPRTNNRSLNSS